MSKNERGVIYMTEACWDFLRVEAARQRLSMGELVMMLIEQVQAAPEGQSVVLAGQIFRHDDNQGDDEK